MRQLVFVHGGETFDTYKDYIDALRSWTYDPERDTSKRWRDSLAEELGSGWQVLMPSMPSKYNAKYLEWCIWFDKVVPYLTDGAVLVGHSLGGIFLAKYLQEGSIPVRIDATFLVAAPHSETEPGESLADFALPSQLDRFASQGGRIFLYHSKDDPVVPFAELGKYKELLPDATVRALDGRGHFLVPEFPEIIDDLKSL
jgi:predicted alpha/beta hydrolase family esterase